MRLISKNALGIVAGLLTLWIGWGVYSRLTTERIQYEVIDHVGGIEFRRYPRTVLVETNAPDSSTAFRRLFRYISGDNERSADIPMTAPVTIRGDQLSITPLIRTLGRGSSKSMTASNRATTDGDSVTMGFYLPNEFSLETAPSSTDPAVELTVEPPRTVATSQFSWYPTEKRVIRHRERLLEELAERGIEPLNDIVLLQYNDPWTPPFMRTNEIEVTVTDEVMRNYL